MATVASLRSPAFLPPRASYLNSSARGLRYDHSSVRNVASDATLRYSSPSHLMRAHVCLFVLELGGGC